MVSSLAYITAGNAGFDPSKIDDMLARVNANQTNASSLPTVVNTFENTTGEFDEKMRRTFDALNEIDPSFVANEALRGNDNPIEVLTKWIEEKQKQEEDQDVVTRAGEFLEQAREEEIRRHQEQWDNAPSSEYPGLTNKEVLQGFRKIVANLPYYSSEAVKRGWIKAEDQPAFEKYLKDELWLKEQERDGKTNTEEYVRRKQEHTVEANANPSFKPATQSTLNAARGQSVDISNSAVGNANILSGNSRISNGSDMLSLPTNTLDDVQPNALSSAPDAAATTSVARALDGNIVTASPSLSGAFNSAADVTTITSAPAQPSSPVVLAQNQTPAVKNYSMSTDML